VVPRPVTGTLSRVRENRAVERSWGDEGRGVASTGQGGAPGGEEATSRSPRPHPPGLKSGVDRLKARVCP